MILIVSDSKHTLAYRLQRVRSIADRPVRPKGKTAIVQARQQKPDLRHTRYGVSTRVLYCNCNPNNDSTGVTLVPWYVAVRVHLGGERPPSRIALHFSGRRFLISLRPQWQR